MNDPLLKYASLIALVTRKVLRSGIDFRTYDKDGAEVYAYPMEKGGRVAWGVNSPRDGFNIVRGIRRPDGTDAMVM